MRVQARGEIETLPSGSLRVRVYAGIDPATRKRRYLMETIPGGPGAAERAEEVRRRLLAEAQQGRAPRPAAFVEVVFAGALGHQVVELLRGVQEGVAGRGLAVAFTDAVGEASAGRDWAADLLARNPAGIVLVNVNGLPQPHGPLPPTVLVDPLAEPAASVPVVVAANRSGAAAAAQHVLDLGHRRIAAISGPTERWSARVRLAGVRAALAAAGRPLDERLLRAGLWYSFEDGLVLGRELLRLPDRPTAVLCGNDLQAFGVLEAARQAGLRVPGDLSVVGFDDVSYARWSGPALTTVRQPFAELGTAAARMILALAAGAAADPRAEVDTTLVVRDSTAAPAGSA